MIVVEKVGKKYRVPLEGGPRTYYNYRTLRETLGLAFTRPAALLKSPPSQEFWALREVSFQVDSGEVFGIIGRNGAGKSTLLKILSRITQPTTGRIRYRGRVGSLLEVGTGFHPELTGRENIFLNGVILGMTRREVAARFDKIVAFAEVEKFLDMPVKRYSSGMYVRLAFAVAAHLDPEILLVDEVLAVGDTAFQKKCLDVMANVARSGRTVLFVSHNLSLVRDMCPKSLLLHQGRLRMIGPTEAVIAEYLSDAATQQGTWQAELDPHHHSEVRILGARILDSEGSPTGTIHCQESLKIEICYEILHPTVSFDVGVRVRNPSGVALFSSYDSDTGNPPPRPSPTGVGVSRCHIPAHLFPPGSYTVSVSIERLCKEHLDRHIDVFGFEVTQVGCVRFRRGGDDGREGALVPIFPWTGGVLDATEPKVGSNLNPFTRFDRHSFHSDNHLEETRPRPSESAT
ncbi:ABC transporter related protein [Isosphaera pallida ATCC 43644]|uniref:ABC transporter related protein n=1 Tax=Isosphaera pallida (strain ATCC 43644 / DSM 9630 / IS1B) TaxID=575540 RepID=E8R3W0_ISOPI|nr:ABC transporter ATP-binding protein [Isosphaera pallida]ADV63690.1 ABC transporter related protein [Isosphaera pallida ATCC 43644]